MEQNKDVKKFRIISARVFAALLWYYMKRNSKIRRGKKKKINAIAKKVHFKREGKSNQTVSFITLIFRKYWTVLD